MTETAIVLFVEHSKHVLATVTRTGDPAAAPGPEELAGERFPYRDTNGDVLVEIEADELASKGVPFEEDLLISPQLCEIAGPVEAPTAQLVGGDAPTVTLAQTGVTVQLQNPATVETPVWAQVDFGTGQTRRHEVLTGTIAAGADTVELTKTLASGPEYDVLVLAKGCEPVEKIDETV